MEKRERKFLGRSSSEMVYRSFLSWAHKTKLAVEMQIKWVEGRGNRVRRNSGKDKEGVRFIQETTHIPVSLRSDDKDKVGKEAGENNTEIKECRKEKSQTVGGHFSLFWWELCFDDSL